MNNVTSTLQYAQDDARPRRRRRRAFLIAASAGVLAVGIRSASGRYRWRLAAKSKFLLMERRCLDYAAPPTRVVYEDDVAEVARAMGPEYRGGGTPRPYLYFSPQALRDHPLLRGVPGPCFVHELRSPSGNRRLVGVDLAPRDRTDFRLVPRVIRPAGLTTPATRVAGQAGLLSMLRGDPSTLRVYAGQPDPADPSRFTIDLVLDGVRATVEGRLNDDDSVTLSPPSTWTSTARSGRTICWPSGSSITPRGTTAVNAPTALPRPR